MEVAQIVAWIGAACQMSQDQRIQYINTDFSSRSDLAQSPENPVFHLKYTVTPLSDNEQCCWHHLFTNAVITKGYPIPDRDPNVQGLEIPIEIMAALGGVRHAMDFDGGLVLKGFSTLFIPVERYGNCIQWHLICYNGGDHISYQELRKRPCTRLMLDTAGDLDHPGGLDHESLWQTRAFLGWWKVTETHLGTVNADYEAIAWSMAMDVGRCTRFSGGTLGFSSTGLGTLNFNLGAKDGRLHFGLQGTYHSIIQRAEKTLVLLFEPNEGERRGWLVPALDVMVHIAHTKHRLTPYTVDKQKVILVPRNPLECRNGAKNMLIANESLKLCDRSYSTSDKDFTFKDLIFDLFSLMDRLIEKDLHSESIPGKSVHATRQETLEGWEYMGLVENVSPLHKKERVIQKSHGGWVDLVNHIDAVVLFGSGFQEVLKPPTRSTGLCQTWMRLPKGKDFLAAGVPILEELYRRAGSYETKEYLTSTHLRWHRNSVLFEDCTASATHTCKCNRLQQIFPKTTLGRINPPGPLEPNGCVIFGQDHHYVGRVGKLAPSKNTIYMLPNTPLLLADEESQEDDDSRSEEHASENSYGMSYENKIVLDPSGSSSNLYEEREFLPSEYINMDEVGPDSEAELKRSYLNNCTGNGSLFFGQDFNSSPPTNLLKHKRGQIFDHD